MGVYTHVHVHVHGLCVGVYMKTHIYIWLRPGPVLEQKHRDRTQALNLLGGRQEFPMEHKAPGALGSQANLNAQGQIKSNQPNSLNQWLQPWFPVGKSMS